MIFSPAVSSGDITVILLMCIFNKIKLYISKPKHIF
jgi:hypothetical protein